MPETTTLELDLFRKLLKIRRVLIGVKNSNSVSPGLEEDRLVWKHKRGHGNCAFLYCNIDFFSCLRN